MITFYANLIFWRSQFNVKTKMFVYNFSHIRKWDEKVSIYKVIIYANRRRSSMSKQKCLYEKVLFIKCQIKMCFDLSFFFCYFEKFTLKTFVSASGTHFIQYSCSNPLCMPIGLTPRRGAWAYPRKFMKFSSAERHFQHS